MGRRIKRARSLKIPDSYRYIMRFCCINIVQQTGRNIKKNTLTNKAQKGLIFMQMSRESMKIYDFIEPELEFYREFCNFTEDERKLFNLRAREVPLEQCAEKMCCDISTIKKLSVRVNKKIIRATDTRKMKEWIDRVYWEKLIIS